MPPFLELPQGRAKYLFPVGLAVLLVVAAGFYWFRAAPRPTVLSPAVGLLISTEQSAEPIRPIPLDLKFDSLKTALGKRLFADRSLSRDGTVSCIDCHHPRLGGGDAKPVSVGIRGSRSEINSPTVFNSGLNFKMNWEGKYDTLFDQVEGPLLNPNVMDGDWSQIVAKLNNSPEYVQAFAEIYSEGITPETVRESIAVYEQSLVTPNARFDRYLRGDKAALNDVEKEGYALFKAYGCVSCHQGINVGGNLFQRFGVIGDYFADRGRETKADAGRFNVTGREEDRYVFRVAGLRNVAVTGPYFHDGSAATLESAIAVMSKYQLGRPLNEDQIKKIKAFLETLTGEFEGVPLDRPNR